MKPAKILDIVEEKPLEPKKEKEDEDYKDVPTKEDEETCKFKGPFTNEKFETLLETYKKASDLVETEGYKNKWKKASYEALLK